MWSFGVVGEGRKVGAVEGERRWLAARTKHVSSLNDSLGHSETICHAVAFWYSWLQAVASKVAFRKVRSIDLIQEMDRS